MATQLQCDLCKSVEFQFLFDHHQQWKVQQCRRCKLTQIIPRPSKKEVSTLYEGDESHFEPYIDQLPVHQSYFRQKLSFLAAELKIKRIKRPKSNFQGQAFSLLDIGCLTGVLLGEAIHLGIKATGVDISLDAVSYCKKKGYQAYHGTIAEYVKKYPQKRFDAVTAFEIIEHEYSPFTMAKTMHAALKDGGLAIATTPNHGSWWRKVMGKYWPGYTHKEHLYFFDMDSLRQVFLRAGFSDVSVRRDQSRPFPLSFLFTRGADYVPFGKGFFRLIGTLLKPLPLINPINPWDDIIVIARK